VDISYFKTNHIEIAIYPSVLKLSSSHEKCDSLAKTTLNMVVEQEIDFHKNVNNI